MHLLEFTAAVTFLYYLLFRADITRPLWEVLDRLPFIGAMGRCALCSGAWLGLGLSWLLPVPVAGLYPSWGLHLWGLIYGALGCPLLLWPVLLALHVTAVAAPTPAATPQPALAPAPTETPQPSGEPSGDGEVLTQKRRACGAAHPANAFLRCTWPRRHSGMHAAQDVFDVLHTWDDNEPRNAA